MHAKDTSRGRARERLRDALKLVALLLVLLAARSSLADHNLVPSGRLLLDGAPVPLRPTPAGLVEALSGRAHLVSLERGGGPDLGPLRLPPGRYLVLGDNRGNSADGRMFGLVPRELIVGCALGVWWRGGGLTWLRL